MTCNFFLNNAFTYGDRRLRGRKLWRGLLSFYVACGVGSFINVALADWLFLRSMSYWAAGLVGAAVAAFWNFLTTASLHLGRQRTGERQGAHNMNTHSFTPRRSEWLEAGLLALVLFCLYAITAPRSIALEDDGLFILSSYFLGIEHPPGYPLHTLLGKLFTYLPVGSVAYRVHLLSGVLGGLSCAALWMCARVLMAGRLPAYVAALGLGFSSVFWSQAIIAEVYTLNTLFFFSLVYLGLRLMPPGTDVAVVPQATRRLAILALLFGFSLANHWPLMLLVAPGFAVLLFPLLRKKLAALPLFVVMVAIGLLPYCGWFCSRGAG